MSVQVRVCIEVSRSQDEEAWIRLDSVETVMPVHPDEEDLSDVSELTKATVRRFSDDLTDRALDQVDQMFKLQEEKWAE